jgi:Mrp family chromosome partitioning ATPase
VLRPTTHRRFFRLSHAKGITNVALGHVALDEALTKIDLATGMPGEHAAPLPRSASVATDGDPGCLDVLASGPLPPNPGDFVGTRKLADILAELRSRYDVVVIDSPPLLRVGDAMTLSSRADGVIVLTRLDVIRRPMLRELSRMLDSVPATKLGYVVTGSQRESGYGYGYGAYGYGEGYSVRDQEVRDGRTETVSSNGRGGVAREEETV